MSKQENYEVLKGNELTYRKVGDYFIPNLELSEENSCMHGEYLKEHCSIQYNDLVLSGQLWKYLADLNEQAHNRLEVIIEQMKAAEGVTEALKAENQMAWVGAINSIHNRAEEIVLHEMIYGGLPYTSVRRFMVWQY